MDSDESKAAKRIMIFEELTKTLIKMREDNPGEYFTLCGISPEKQDIGEDPNGPEKTE